jgi:hypothetical protein
MQTALKRCYRFDRFDPPYPSQPPKLRQILCCGDLAAIRGWRRLRDLCTLLTGRIPADLSQTILIRLEKTGATT